MVWSDYFTYLRCPKYNYETPYSFGSYTSP
jgi:hypothetical protein